MKTVHLKIQAILFISAFIMAKPVSADIEFKADLCFGPSSSSSDSVTIVFLNADHDSKSFSFVSETESVNINHPEMSGLMSFDDIESVKILGVSENEKHIVIVLKKAVGFFFKVKELEFGIVDQTCLELIIGNVGSKVSIIELAE